MTYLTALQVQFNQALQYRAYILCSAPNMTEINRNSAPDSEFVKRIDLKAQITDDTRAKHDPTHNVVCLALSTKPLSSLARSPDSPTPRPVGGGKPSR